jgi:NitT/TauT family transport system substrate-binding protein
MITWIKFASGAAAATALQLTIMTPPVFAAERPALGLSASNSLVSKVSEMPVSIRFSWKLKGEYAPFYVALDKGYFKELGVDVTLGEGAGAPATITSVIQGKDTATYAPGIYGLQAVSKGLPLKLVALYHPATPMAIVSLPANPVRTPKDLEDKSYGVSVGDTVGDFLPVLCTLNKIDCSKIKRVNLNLNALITELVAQHIDATSAYATNDLPILKAKGIDLVIMDLREHGLKVPGGSLIVSNTTIQEHPDVLRNLLAGLEKGFAFCKKDPLESARIMKKHWTTALDDNVVAEQIRQTVDATTVVPGKPIGWIESKVLATSLDQMKEADKIDKIVPVGDYYTNDLLSTN